MISLKELQLKEGPHKNPSDGLCIMEAVAYFAKEKHSDKPECACPVLTSYMIIINDCMNDTERQMLKPYIKKLIGTRDGKSNKRLEILMHYPGIKVAPYALKLLAGLNKNAKEMRSLKSGDYNAAKNAAWSVAKNAAWSAAESVAWSAASAAESAAEKDRAAYWQIALNALDEALAV